MCILYEENRDGTTDSVHTDNAATQTSAFDLWAVDTTKVQLTTLCNTSYHIASAIVFEYAIAIEGVDMAAVLERQSRCKGIAHEQCC